MIRSRRVLLSGLAVVGLVAGLFALLRNRSADGPAEQSGPEGRAGLADQSGRRNPSSSRGSPATVPRFQVQTGRARHFQAIRAKDEARRTGARVPRSADLFEGEERDPVWAQAMETTLQGRLREDARRLQSAGLKDLQIPEVECRTSTCRMSFEYTNQAFGTKSPYDILVENTGPFSESSSDLRPEALKVVDGVTHYRQTVYLLLGERESDPNGYGQWVAEVHQRHLRFRSKAPPVVIRGLPPPEMR
jgi:hypothetical protein